MDWFQIKKEARQGCILLPCLFNLYADYIMWNAELDEAQAGIKIARRNIDNLRYADGWIWLGKSPVAQLVKNLPANAGDIRDMGSILGLGISPGKGNGNTLQYSCLENSMDRGT